MNWREIPLTRGFVAIVDPADYDELAQFAWHVTFSGAQRRRPYARRTGWANGEWFAEMLHRRLLPTTYQVDHINGNSLDNRRSNLREATHTENQRNQGSIRSNNTSGFRGVSWHRGSEKWRAQLQIAPGVRKHLGYFRELEDAARAFDEAAINTYGAFVGRLNFPDEVAP